MNWIWYGLLAPALLLAQKPGSPAPVAPPIPRIGIVDFYGLHKVSPDRVLKTLGVREGDLLPPSKEEVEEHLESIPEVVQARLEAVCCPGGSVSLFVGIEERGAPHFALRSVPAGAALLPPDVMDDYGKFLSALRNAAARGKGAEDLTQGHSLMADPDARAFQTRFLAIARDQLPLLSDVLRNSSDEEHRAAAAYIIGYAPKKADVINDLQLAMQDPAPGARSNAMRALAAIGVLATREPAQGIRISPTWFVEMLNSIVLSDRHRAAIALGSITADGGAGIEHIRERALDAVVEMARWKTLEYALPAFILAGRIAGESDLRIHEAWKSGDRETLIKKALSPGRRPQ